ncbi:MAG TPA: response regulator [Bryobacteraceae bacterium]|nr:response regulator [Bryobacteraceae bacterium]
MSNPTSSRGRILIVEDQGIVATDIERCLEDNGFEVTGIATSMDEAILEASKSLPDLVLMDIRIKGESDGIETGIAFTGISTCRSCTSPPTTTRTRSGAPSAPSRWHS